jgi:hypothetical protein
VAARLRPTKKFSSSIAARLHAKRAPPSCEVMQSRCMKLKRPSAARFLWQLQVYDLVMFDIRRYSREEALEFYEQIRAADPHQRIVFLTGPPKYVSRTWPGEIAEGDSSRGQWAETVKRFLTAA